MFQKDFVWTFATNDAFTVQYVRNEHIPKLKADIAQMQSILNHCIANNQAIDAVPSLAESIGRRKQEIDIAERRLQWADSCGATSGDTPQIAVAIEGGLVQAVVANDPSVLGLGLKVQIIDYDTDGVDEQDLLLVPQGDGSLSEARGHVEGVAKADINIAGVRPKIVRQQSK